jgi:hypothetical protein
MGGAIGTDSFDCHGFHVNHFARCEVCKSFGRTVKDCGSERGPKDGEADLHKCQFGNDFVQGDKGRVKDLWTAFRRQGRPHLKKRKEKVRRGDYALNFAVESLKAS